jgi:glycosyltransferase involved in cell wall biosynthesis
MTAPEKTILLGWQASSNFGWGLVGLNIFFHWAATPGLRPMLLLPIEEEDLRMVDPLRRQRAQAAIDFSNDAARKILAAIGSQKLAMDIPVIHGAGNGFGTPDQNRLTGKPNIGRTIFEDTTIGPIMDRIEMYDALLCASEWAAGLLRAHTAKPVKVIHEAIDPSLFFPGPKSGMMDASRFYVFTGGKVEFRKGQDLVMLAFREFSRRHDDAMLVTSWQSPWAERAAGFKGRLEAPISLDANKKLDVKRWAAENGIDPNKVIDIGIIPNQLLPMVLREMDCALQPSRAEACTNMLVKEAMACGLPVIAAANTGVKDLIREGNCIPLLRQTPIVDRGNSGCEGWGESDVEEMIEALERLYASAELRRTIGATAATFMQDRTWGNHAAKLKDWLFSF